MDLLLPDDLSAPVTELSLSIRSRNVMVAAGILTVGAMLAIADDWEALLRIPGLGATCRFEISAMAQRIQSQSNLDGCRSRGGEGLAWLRAARARGEPALLAPVSELPLSPRTRARLTRLEISTVDALLEAVWNQERPVRTVTLGARACDEVLPLAEQVRVTGIPLTSSSGHRKILDLPAGSPPALPLLLDDVARALLANTQLEVLDLRFGRHGSRRHSLNTIGKMRNVSGEYVRQVQDRALKRLHCFLHGDPVAACPYLAPAAVAAEARSLREALSAMIQPIAFERDVFEMVSLRYAAEPPPSELRMLLALLGFCPLGWPADAEGPSAWSLPLSQTFLAAAWKASPLIQHCLASAVSPVTLPDLVHQISDRGGRTFEAGHVQVAIALVPGVEPLDGGYQLRFEHLPRLADQAHRVLHEHGAPLHFRDLAREVNRRRASANVAATTPKRLASRMSDDPRLEAVGRSGKWKLATWKDVVTQPVHQTMAEFLRDRGTCATVDEILQGVRQRHPDAPRRTIEAYLSIRAEFRRVSRAEHALAEWGGVPYTPRPCVPSGQVRPRVREALIHIFAESRGEMVPRPWLVHRLFSLTGIPESTIYRTLWTIPGVTLVPDPDRKKSVLVAFDPDSSAGDLTRKSLLKKVEDEAVRYLESRPTRTAPLAEVTAHLASALQASQVTMYAYLARLPRIGREDRAGVRHCFVIEPPPTG